MNLISNIFRSATGNNIRVVSFFYRVETQIQVSLKKLLSRVVMSNFTDVKTKNTVTNQKICDKNNRLYLPLIYIFVVKFWLVLRAFDSCCLQNGFICFPEEALQ